MPSFHSWCLSRSQIDWFPPMATIPSQDRAGAREGKVTVKCQAPVGCASVQQLASSHSGLLGQDIEHRVPLRMLDMHGVYYGIGAIEQLRPATVTRPRAFLPGLAGAPSRPAHTATSPRRAPSRWTRPCAICGAATVRGRSRRGEKGSSKKVNRGNARGRNEQSQFPGAGASPRFGLLPCTPT